MTRTESKIDKWYCMMLAVAGLIMSFVMPVLQSPDEQSHLRMIAASLENESIADNILNDIEANEYKIYMDDSKDIHSYRISISDYLQMMTKKPEYSWNSVLPHGVNLSIVKHLPSAVGVMIGCMLRLPSLAVLQLAEACSVLVYVLLIYASLKILPVKKTFFRCFAISPMVVQQIASINYDAVLLPLCFLFIAYVLYIKFKKDEFCWKDLLILISLLLMITYIKIPYFFLGVFAFVIPLRKYQIKAGVVTIDESFVKKYKLWIIVSVLISILLGGYLIRNQYYVRLAVSMIQEWRRTYYLFNSTIITWGKFLFVSSVGNFGWLDTPVSLISAVLIYVAFSVSACCCITDKEETMKWRIQDYFIVLTAFVMLCILITMSMVNHTITVTLYGFEQICDYNMREALYQIPYIGGLQGRYYVPFLMLPFMLLPQTITVHSMRNKRILRVISILFFPCVAVYISYLLLNRYWII